MKLLRALGKLLGFLAKTAAVLFAATFVIYWFNLENKLLYYVVRPFLNKHYDSQQRDRRV